MIDFQSILTTEGLISLLTLSLLEIVLGIDNVIFISIVSTKLPKHQQKKARSIGLSLALVFRIILLFSISWIVGLKEPLFTLAEFETTGRDLILMAGGLFLLIKTSIEIRDKIYHVEAETSAREGLTLKNAIIQIVFLDIIFSFDSILTAVGLVTNVLLMVIAVIIAMIIMLVFSSFVSDFINKHPTVKMLALAFLLVIGAVLCAEAIHLHVEKAYIYVALGFSLLVESLNMAMRSQAHRKPVRK
jgi:predicted tellurium resistance membrane protein TerC